MNTKLTLTKWELYLSWVLFVLVGVLVDSYFTHPAHAGVTDDAYAVRRAVEHIDRLLSNHAHVHGGFVP
jgi:hypothetical protein